MDHFWMQIRVLLVLVNKNSLKIWIIFYLQKSCGLQKLIKKKKCKQKET